MKDSVSAAKSARAEFTQPSLLPRIRETFTMKRLAIMSAAAALIIATVLAGFMPRCNPAMAAVARAISSVSSMHCSGWVIEGKSKRQVQFWVDSPSKARVRVEGLRDLIVDGEKFTEITPRVATIRRYTRHSPRNGEPEFAMFFSGDYWQARSRDKSIRVERVTAENGKSSVVFTVGNA